MDVSMPIAADINYTLGFARVGVDYYGIGRSYNLNQGTLPKQYVDQSSQAIHPAVWKVFRL